MSREYFSPHAAELPLELKQQLNSHYSITEKILDVLYKGGGTLNISEILVGLYKTHNLIMKRAYITNVLYKMRKRDLLRPTENVGEYSRKETT